MANPLYAFIHIPKCAGTTLAGVLQSVYGKEFYEFPGSVVGESHFDGIDLDRYKVIKGHFAYQFINRFTRREVRYVCFFREPLQRLLSYYTFILSEKDNTKHVWTAGFPNFYTWVQSKMLACLDNDIVRFLSGRSEINYCSPGEPVNDNDFRDACNNLRRLAFVGMQEDFDRSLLGLAELMDWSSFPQYENKRVQAKRRLVIDLPSVTTELLEDTQKYDLALYREVEHLYIRQDE